MIPLESVAVAIDIGGSKGMIGLVCEGGAVLYQERFVWSVLTKEGILNQVTEAINTALSKYPGMKPCAMGINIPGLADAARGIWVEASFSGICDWPIADLMSKLYNLPCFADNDANASALAEYHYGGARGMNDFLYLTVSNGIGGAAFVAGKLLRGYSNNAVEIGHCTAVSGGRSCGCGKRGCLEMHASGRGIAQNYAEMGGAPADDGSMACCELITERALKGEATALRVFDLEGEYLGKAIATASNLLNPQHVFIGGGVSLSFSLFEAALIRSMKEHLYYRANPTLGVSPTSLGYNGALLGAAALAFQGLKS